MPRSDRDARRIFPRAWCRPRRGLALALCSALAGGDAAWADVAAIPPATCQAMKDGHVLTDASPVPCDRLREVSFRFIDFAGETRPGRVAVMDAVARPVLDLFDELPATTSPTTLSLDLP
jgi:hypothetical protein